MKYLAFSSLWERSMNITHWTNDPRTDSKLNVLACNHLAIKNACKVIERGKFFIDH